MEIESALPPPFIRLNHSNRHYAFRVLKQSQFHPIKVEFNQLIAKRTELELLGSDLSNLSLNSPSRFKFESQIQRLLKSISPLIDFPSLEIIKHFYFPPWDLEVPYNIKISNKPKQEEAKLHLKYLQSISNSNITSIYIDGSQTEKGLGIGFGFAVYNHIIPSIPLEPIHREFWNIGNRAIVYNGELEGVTKAIEYASEIAKEGEYFNIFTDNQAGILRLKTPSDNPGQSQQIRAIKATNRLNSKGASLDIIWVPGHIEITGNEEADKLAKKAIVTKVYLSDKTSFAFLGI
jgi:ribonuclease HI